LPIVVDNGMVSSTNSILRFILEVFELVESIASEMFSLGVEYYNGWRGTFDLSREFALLLRQSCLVQNTRARHAPQAGHKLRF